MSLATVAAAIANVAAEHAAGVIAGKMQTKAQMEALKYRKNQVFDNNVELSAQDWHKTKVCIQRHNATRRGLHHDIRFEHKGRMVSFVIDKEIPKKERVNVIRTVDHKISYNDFEGIIPKGEFGAGKVKLVYNGDGAAVVRTDHSPTRVKILVPEGKAKGIYVFVQMYEDKWKMHKMDLPKPLLLDRHKYILKNLDYLEKIDQGKYVAEEKMDGAYSTLKITKTGTSIGGRRLSVTKQKIDYTYKLPHIAEIKSDTYNGTIINGEVYHQDGVNATSGLLNSKIPKAIELGKPKVYIFGIRKLMVNGKEVKIKSYTEEQAYLDKLTELSDFLCRPKTTTSGFTKFYEKTGEGMVLKPIDGGPWIKIVKTKRYDLKIISITKGTGKFEGNGIGAFIVSDADGSHTAKVGTGLNDQIRQDAYAHPENYIGKIITVAAKMVTKKSLRGPVFKEIRADKDIADNIDTVE